jgi:DNA-binding transcriptional LysR family regulator
LKKLAEYGTLWKKKGGRLMELRQLKYFLAVADARSFVSAADTLFISRQAISKSVAQLEQELNVELFMRDSGGAFLTPAGMMFYERVRSLVMELDSVRSQMQSYGKRYQQRIHIAFSVGTVRIMEQRLLEYRENHPNVDITYEEQPESVCRQMLLEHKADLIVTTSAVEDPLFLTQEILSDPLGLLIKPQQELQEVMVKDLSWIPLAGLKDNQIETFCSRNGIHLRYSGFDTQRLLDLTAKGKCAMLVPECLVPETMANLAWIPIDDGGNWALYSSYARNARKNLMYSDVLQDIHKNVLIERSEGGK